MTNARTFLYVGMFVLTMLVAVFMRIEHLDQLPPGLHVDESINISHAREIATSGVLTTYFPEFGGRESLFMYALSVPAFFGSTEVASFRLVPAVIGIVTVLSVYLLVITLFAASPHRHIIGLFAIALVATSIWHINFSRIMYRGILVPLFVTYGLLFMHLALEKKRVLYAVMAGIVIGMGCYSYTAFFVFPVVVAIIFVCFYRDAWKYVFLIGAATALTLVPMLLTLLDLGGGFLARAQHLSASQHETMFWDILLTNVQSVISMTFLHGDGNLRHGIPGRPLINDAALVGIILFAVGFVYQLLRHRQIENHKPLLILLITWAVMHIPMILANQHSHALRSIGALVPLYVMAAYGLALIATYKDARIPLLRLPVAVLVAAIVLIGRGYEARHEYQQTWAEMHLNPYTDHFFDQQHVAYAKTMQYFSSNITKIHVLHRSWDVYHRGGVMRTNAEEYMPLLFDFENNEQLLHGDQHYFSTAHSLLNNHRLCTDDAPCVVSFLRYFYPTKEAVMSSLCATFPNSRIIAEMNHHIIAYTDDIETGALLTLTNGHENLDSIIDTFWVRKNACKA